MQFSRRSFAVAGAVLASCFFAHAPEADAQPSVPKADVLIIHATQCERPSVDKEIGEAPPLKYNCYKLVNRTTLNLVKGQPASTVLPNGRTFQLTLTDLTPDKRFKVSAAISNPQGGFMKLADITSEANKQFHVGGWAHQGGALVVGIRINP